MVICVPAAKYEYRLIYLNGDMFGNTYRRNWKGNYHDFVGEIKAMMRD